MRTRGTLSLAEATAKVVGMGGTVRHARGTGEVVFEHPLADGDRLRVKANRLRVKANRKDASDVLMHWIRRIEGKVARLRAVLEAPEEFEFTRCKRR